MNERLVDRLANVVVLGWIFGMATIVCGVLWVSDPSKLGLEIFYSLVATASALIVVPCVVLMHETGLFDEIMDHSAFRDPRKRRVNGKWVLVEEDGETEEIIQSLEDLQEASR